ncbi:MAG: transglutaminase family protein [Alphaproteobacteria bacterium]
MLISIHHRTSYRYDRPFNHAIQALRLTPPAGDSQAIHSWAITCPGIERAAHYRDAFGNDVHLVTPPGETNGLEIEAKGVIETFDRAGVVGTTNDSVPPAIFLRPTTRTAESSAIATMASQCRRATRLETLHALLPAIHESVAYDTDATHALTTAAEAFKSKRGVCQDHAHIFIAAARVLSIPARYVTGYLLIAGETSAVAHHAWAEAYTEDLGWIGFDAANGVCPTDHYARLAIGFDAAAAAPVRGTMRGAGAEDLSVEVVVRAGDQ